MRKPRADSTWNEFTNEQIGEVESWLFDEKLGYAKTVKRVGEEFGMEVSMASVGRYFRRRAQERQFHELLSAQVVADTVNRFSVSTDSLRAAAVKLAGKAAIKLAAEKPEQVGQLASLIRLLLDSEDMEIRRGRLKLAQQEFHFRGTAAAQMDMPRLRAFLDVVFADPALNAEEKIDRLHDILFGWGHAKANPAGRNPSSSEE